MGRKGKFYRLNLRDSLSKNNISGEMGHNVEKRSTTGTNLSKRGQNGSSMVIIYFIKCQKGDKLNFKGSKMARKGKIYRLNLRDQLSKNNI